MGPLATVTASVAALYIIGRGSLIVAPAATVAFYRRVIFSTPGRLRMFGVGILVLIGVPLMLTARQAPAAPGDATMWLQGLGWLAVVVGVGVTAGPGRFQRLADSMLLSASHSALRARGVLGVALGFFLGWVAFFVL